MTQVFFAWELGANLGHIGAFVPLAKLLRERGHEVHWALAKTNEAANVLRPLGFSWMQAPTSLDHRPGHSPENYASILLHHGYGQAQTLLGMVEAWRSLMRLSAADVVLVDHAPTAILAARTLGLPVMNHGNGFTIPPRSHPTPLFRSWSPVPTEILMQNDTAALATINRVLDKFSCPPINTLGDLFDIAEPALLTFPELDHYSHRGPARYWGLSASASGVSPQWPVFPGPKVFAYVRPVGKHHAAVLNALKQLDASVLVVAPGLSEASRQPFIGSNLSFAETTVNLQQAAEQAKLGVLWSGGGNTTLAFLMAGKPVVVLPNQIEPFLQGLRVQHMGAGLVADLDVSLDALPKLLEQGLTDTNLIRQAEAFAARYRDSSSEQRLQHMALRLEELAGQ